jgi:hypothetical protein
MARTGWCGRGGAHRLFRCVRSVAYVRPASHGVSGLACQLEVPRQIDDHHLKAVNADRLRRHFSYWLRIRLQGSGRPRGGRAWRILMAAVLRQSSARQPCSTTLPPAATSIDSQLKAGHPLRFSPRWISLPAPCSVPEASASARFPSAFICGNRRSSAFSFAPRPNPQSSDAGCLSGAGSRITLHAHGVARACDCTMGSHPHSDRSIPNSARDAGADEHDRLAASIDHDGPAPMVSASGAQMHGDPSGWTQML